MRSLTSLIFAVIFGLAAFAEPVKMANLVVFVRFADENKGHWQHDRDYYEKMFNDTTQDANSVRNFFLDMSYGRFDWESTFAEVEYQDSHTRGYFQPKSSTNPDGYSSLDVLFDTRFKTLIKDMCIFLEDKLPEDIELDRNNDGEIDNIVIIISGKSDLSASKMLWPMNNRGATAELRGLKSGNFLRVFDQANGYKSMVPQPLNTGVLCHEMMHTLNAFDLYTSGDNKLEPVNIWDLMSDNQFKPQGMTAYMRSEYGKYYGDWIPEEKIPTLTEEGTYTLPAISTRDTETVAYKIVPDPAKPEYFMLEYRDNSNVWDCSLPASGLLVYRVNPSLNGNTGANFEVYIFRPGGSTDKAGSIAKAPLGPDTKRYTFGTENDDDYPFYSDGTRAPFSISGVQKAGKEISFKVKFSSTGDSGIDDLPADNDSEKIIYNMQGIRIREITSPGLYIINGKKVLVN